MRRLSKIALLIVTATVAAVAVSTIVALVLSFESEPRVAATAAPTAEEIAQFKDSLKRQDPRRLDPGEVGTVSLSERELAIALSQALALHGSSAAVLIDLRPGRLALQASLELPTERRRRFLNLDMLILETEHLPRLERLRVGRTRLPARPADAAWRWAVGTWLEKRGAAGLLEMIESVALGEDRLDVAYRWQSAMVDRVRASIVGETEIRRLEAFSNELAGLTRELSSQQIPLAALLGPLFELAHRRSRTGDPAVENRSAILVLEAYVNRRRLHTLVPEAATWPHPRPVRATLRGQHDLAQHFMTSALVAAVGGSGLSEALGIEKELADSRGGSGFSFQDLAADRAGARFGRLATSSRESARRIQQTLGEEPLESDLLPRVEDLPESLSEAELHRLIGPVGSLKYQQLTAEIDRRIGASPLYRRP